MRNRSSLKIFTTILSVLASSFAANAKHRLNNMLRFGVALIVLVGWSSVASAQWTALANAFPSGFASTCVLLTDGTLMCHEYGTNRWHRLKPDINGSYQNGSWDVPGFTVAPMPPANDPTIGCVNCTYAPTFFASAVLGDGRVVVIGGEYNEGFCPHPPNNCAVWTNIGFMYDPVTNTWSGQITVPGTWCCTGGGGTGGIGDAQCTILTNGTMLLASTASTDIAAFDPATLTFTALAPTGKDDGNDQENWNQLPNGKVLTVDSTTPQRSEVYNPATNGWEAAVDTQVNLADWGPGTLNSAEVGPAVLRPDGTIIAFSGTNSGQNAVYNTATGTWAATGAAGDFPLVPGQTYHYAVADGPACLLPNGNVLVMASPVTDLACGNPPPPPPPPCGVFNTPSHFFEFDGTNLTQVADSPNAASFVSYQGRMLLLPTGEVLLTAYNQQTGQLLRPNARTNSLINTLINTPSVAIQDVVLYSNGGAPQDAWRPVITTAPCQVVAGNTYSISGTLFNGFSEGASYGDDAQMSTNYPLVRIINHASGHVFYARTHDHSRMGVEPVDSSEIVTTQFDVPLDLESGPSDLIVVVNGIPSLPAQVNAIADLSVTKAASPDPVTTGNDLTYTVTVTNSGPDTATSVTLTDNLPAETTFVSCSSTGGGVCGGSGNNRTVTFASLASGESETITFVATVNCSVADGIVISNTATVSSCALDPDPTNNSATATTTASNPPPTITDASANPSVLWPPNHRMVNVTVSYDVTDNCPLPPGSCTLSVTSNEPVGHTSPDWIVVDDHHVLLRAEREGNGNGRIYTITITCVDSGGNTSTDDVTVTVPHDRGASGKATGSRQWHLAQSAHRLRARASR
jgi:uncharacterized repeat protein (TIGR01451 family)